MRDKFPGYYRRTEHELDHIWEDGLFVLDANVLLNLYRYSEKTREELLEVMREVRDQLWIPNQVAEEFHGRRLEAIEDQKSAYRYVRKILKVAQKSVADAIKGIHEDSGIRTRDLLQGVKESFDGFVADTERMERESGILSIRLTDSPEDDEIWRAVLDILEGRTGEGLSRERKRKILDEEGPRRYEAEVPPGYEDLDKPGDRKFGDLILWFEIVDKAKEIRKPVLFVTADQKGDWYQKTGGKASAPRPELVNELHEEAGVLFYALPPLRFLKQASERFNREISRETAEEIDEELNPPDEEDERFELEKRIDELTAFGGIRDLRESDAREVMRRLEDARSAARGVDIGELLRDSDIREIARKSDIREIQRQVEAASEAQRVLDVERQIRESQEALRAYRRLRRDYGV